jgi:hypothetical protein
MPMVDKTRRKGYTEERGRKARMSKSTKMVAVEKNLDFCLTEVRFKYTDRITHEVTMKNCRKDSSCS